MEEKREISVHLAHLNLPSAEITASAVYVIAGWSCSWKKKKKNIPALNHPDDAQEILQRRQTV